MLLFLPKSRVSRVSHQGRLHLFGREPLANESLANPAQFGTVANRPSESFGQRLLEYGDFVDFVEDRIYGMVSGCWCNAQGF